MKANVTLSKEHSTLCIDVKNEKKAYTNQPLRKFLSKDELQESKTEMLVIPVEQLTDVQYQQIQKIPGAYLLTTDHLLNKTNQHQSQLPGNDNEHSLKSYRKRFLVKHSTRLISLGVDQIAYFYAENRLNFIKTWNNKTYIIDKTVEEINSIINKDEFFRINRSYIISYKAIEEVHAHFNNRLKLKLNIAVSEELFVSKDRVANFKEWLGA